MCYGKLERERGDDMTNEESESANEGGRIWRKWAYGGFEKRGVDEAIGYMSRREKSDGKSMGNFGEICPS